MILLKFIHDTYFDYLVNNDLLYVLSTFKQSNNEWQFDVNKSMYFRQVLEDNLFFIAWNYKVYEGTKKNIKPYKV